MPFRFAKPFSSVTPCDSNPMFGGENYRHLPMTQRFDGEDSCSTNSAGIPMKVQVAVLAHDSEGSPAFFVATIKCTHAEYMAGNHYEKAKVQAGDFRYEGPMIAFDNTDAAFNQLTEVAEAI